MDDSTGASPRLFFDLGSPYSWLAFERAERILGEKVRLEPILIGGIFVLRDQGSWSQTSRREENVTEIERRAEAYGLGPVWWPENWPDNTLRAMRSTVWAERQGRLEAFTSLAFRAAFKAGGDLSDKTVLTELATGAGLDPQAMLVAIDTEEVKAELRSRTNAAWTLGVTGAPVLLVGGKLFYGDDRLEEAAGAVRVEDPRR